MKETLLVDWFVEQPPVQPPFGSVDLFFVMMTISGFNTQASFVPSTNEAAHHARKFVHIYSKMHARGKKRTLPVGGFASIDRHEKSSFSFMSCIFQFSAAPVCMLSARR